MKLNDKFVDDYEYEYIISNNKMLIDKILDLKQGQGFDWCEFENKEITTTYRVEKLNWEDSIVVLIGGYGGLVLSCWCDSETYYECNCGDREIVTGMVNDFFNSRFIDESELIIISSIAFEEK